MNALRYLVGGLLALALLLIGPGVVPEVLAGPAASPPAGPAGRPDPKQMSGIPRPDPQVPGGEITVRVLRGSFDAPALGETVELELRSADGRRTELRAAETQNQGRAYFRELEPFVGGTAIARLVLDGEALSSQPMGVRPDVGTAVMLVAGAGGGEATPGMSLPGIPFTFDRVPAGTLMIGVMDLATREGIGGVDVELVVTQADGTQEVRQQKTAEAGQTSFEGMAELPEGVTLQVLAQIEPGEPYRSTVFRPAPGEGQAVVLAKGEITASSRSPHQGGDPHGGQGPAPLPPPKISSALQAGTVRVRIVDGRDAPVADHELSIIQKSFSGTEKGWRVTTNAQGEAQMADLPLVKDGLYYVAITYDDGPYTSPFFRLDQRGGVVVPMRVWETTTDVRVVRSVLQIEVFEGENDMASIWQEYSVRTMGDKAYWPAKPLHIDGQEGAKGFKVFPDAEDWLDHDEKAPFATLARPLPPGEVATLAVAYLVEHDGTIEYEWQPPFEVVEAAIIVPESLDLSASGARRSDKPVPARRGIETPQVAYVLGALGASPVRATITGLRRTNHVFAWIGQVVGAVLALVVILGIALRPRGDARARLERRRDALLATLEAKPDLPRRRRADLLAALDRVYRQLDALDVLDAKQPRPRAQGSGAQPPAG